MSAPCDFYPRRTVTLRRRLPLDFRPPRKLLRITEEDVRQVVERLDGRGWQTGVSLGARSGGEKRKLKAIVEVAAGAILHFPGSPGYKLISEARPSEIRRGIAILRAEARRPLRMALNYRRHLKRRASAVTPQFNFEENQ
jgi:hypothetical protein